MTTDDLRPTYHLTPQRHWINDPNGLVFIDDTYHVFFQHNPLGNDWGNMSWGHMTSTDLIGWTEHPVAIPCDRNEMVFSGSVVFDADNTSGLGPTGAGRGPLVAIYTSVSPEGLQTQALASSTDGGYEWLKYPGNPVLDRGSTDFRDPKVVRFVGDADAFWLMTVVEAVDQTVLLYRSDDLKDWKYLSSITVPDVVDGQVWECPDLVRVGSVDTSETVWILIVSVNPAGRHGGSGTMYLLGDFDGRTFSPRDEPPRWLDAGCDYYAATTFSGLPSERVITFGWMSNWRYAAHVPTDPWRGGFSLPREITYRVRRGRADGDPSVVVCQQVAAEIDNLVGDAEELDAVPFALTEERRFPQPRGARVRLAFDPGDADGIQMHFFAATDVTVDPAIKVCYSPADGRLDIHRTPAGPAAGVAEFGASVSTHLHDVGDVVDLIVWIDTASIELQTVDGATWLTMLAFPHGSQVEWTLSATGGQATVQRLEISPVGR